MKLLFKILISFIMITLIINGLTFFSFFLTFEKTNEQNTEIYTLSKKLFQINVIIERNLDLQKLVEKYPSGEINSKQLTNKVNELKESVDGYILIEKEHQEHDSEYADLYADIQSMENSIKKMIKLKEEYNPRVTNEILNFKEISIKYEQTLRQHYREYEVETEKYHTEFQKQYGAGLNLMIITSVLMVLFIIMLGVFITYQIINPINHIIDVSKKVSKGEDAKANIQSDDEFGDMGFAFNMMIDKIYNKNKELEGKITELEKFTKLVVDREIKMVELKRKIEELEKK